MDNYKEALRIIGKIEMSEDRVHLMQELMYKVAIRRPSAIIQAQDPDVRKTLDDYMRDKAFPIHGKISCIKIYRHLTQVGLKEAKEAVEKLNIAGVYGNLNINTLTPHAHHDAYTEYIK